MIIFSGYGLLIVAGIYACSFWIMSKLIPNAGDAEQIVAILITMIIATVINYLVARFLNRNGVKHTLYQIKLQTSVLIIGGLMVALTFLTQWKYIMQFIQELSV